jgi:hypothetical protein
VCVSPSAFFLHLTLLIAHLVCTHFICLVDVGALSSLVGASSAHLSLASLLIVMLLVICQDHSQQSGSLVVLGLIIVSMSTDCLGSTCSTVLMLSFGSVICSVVLGCSGLLLMVYLIVSTGLLVLVWSFLLLGTSVSSMLGIWAFVPMIFVSSTFALASWSRLGHVGLISTVFAVKLTVAVLVVSSILSLVTSDMVLLLSSIATSVFYLEAGLDTRSSLVLLSAG